MSVLGNLFKAAHGAVNVIGDVGSAIHHAATFDMHALSSDMQKIAGDVGDFVNGSAGLGSELAMVAEKYVGRFIPKALESPPLEAAQLAIEGLKATTGSGEPVDGAGFLDGKKFLEDAVESLLDARRDEDRWGGTASDTYTDTNDRHRRLVSAMSVADQAIAEALGAEAKSISDTRKSLDDLSQYLYDAGLATAWLAGIPGGLFVKWAIDTPVAAAGLSTATVEMTKLTADVVRHASKVRGAAGHYRDAADQGVPTDGACAPFGEQPHDLPPQTAEGFEPGPLKPEKPRQYGPHATPYDTPQSAPVPANPVAPGSSSIPSGLPTPAGAPTAPVAPAPAAFAGPAQPTSQPPTLAATSASASTGVRQGGYTTPNAGSRTPATAAPGASHRPASAAAPVTSVRSAESGVQASRASSTSQGRAPVDFTSENSNGRQPEQHEGAATR